MKRKIFSRFRPMRHGRDELFIVLFSNLVSVVEQNVIASASDMVQYITYVVGSGKPLDLQPIALSVRATFASPALLVIIVFVVDVIYVNNLLFEADREKKTRACLLSL